MEWVEPWQPIEVEMDSAYLTAELHRELPPGHPLFGQPLRAIGCRPDRDDVLFAFEDGSERVAVVHLTWRGDQERLPWPISTVYSGFVGWTMVERRAADN